MDIYKNIEEYNPNKKHQILIVLDDMIADMLICLVIKKQLNSIVTELFIKGRKPNNSLGFITQSYFKVPKDVRLNTMHLLRNFYYKNSKQKKSSTNCAYHSSDIDLKDFMNLYKKCTAKPYSFLVIDTTLASDNLLHFRKNLSERI